VAISLAPVISLGIYLNAVRKNQLIDAVSIVESVARVSSDLDLIKDQEAGMSQGRGKDAASIRSTAASIRAAMLQDLSDDLIDAAVELGAFDIEMSDRLFTSYDDDGSGSVESNEMMQFCKHIGLDMPEELVVEIMKAIQNEDVLNKTNFLTFVAAYKRACVAHSDSGTFELYPEGGNAWAYDAKLRAKGKLWKNILLTQYLLVPPTTALSCAAFVCDPRTLGMTDEDFPHPVLRADSSVECYTPRHANAMLLGYLGIILYAFITPLFWIALLYKNRHELNSFRISQQLGFFYICYKDRTLSTFGFVWDVIETLRKLLLGSLVVFVQPGSTTQLGFFFVVCLCALVAHLHVKPFKADLDNTLQANALLAIVVTVFFAIFKMGTCVLLICYDTY
jgi:hypothetical protein